MTSVVCSNGMAVRNDLDEQSKLIQLVYDCLSRLIAIHSLVFAAVCIYGRIVVHDIDFRQVVTLTNLEIVRVVSRRYLNAARSKLHINVFVRNDGYLPVGKRQFQHFSDNIFIALIVRINGNGGISEHRLGACCCYLHKSAVLAHNGIIYMPEKSVLFLVLNLRIRK